MLKKEDIIKIECRNEVLKHIKKKMDNITISDFYDEKEYEIIRQEYLEMAELIRDKDSLVKLKEKQKQEKYKKTNKYFDIEK